MQHGKISGMLNYLIRNYQIRACRVFSSYFLRVEQRSSLLCYCRLGNGALLSTFISFLDYLIFRTACILRVSIWCIEFSYLFNHLFLFFYTFQISNSICASFYCLASSLKYLLRQMFHCGGRSLNQVFSIFWSWLPLSILIVYWQC